MLKTLIALCGICLFSCAYTQPIQPPPSPPPADSVFSLQVTAIDTNAVSVHFDISPGFELYKDNMQFTVLKPKAATIGTPLWPKAITKTIPTIGTLDVYQNTLDFELPLTNLPPQTKTITLQVTYQGCSEQGFCYPPIQKITPINLPNGSTQTVTQHSPKTPPPTKSQPPSLKPIILTLLTFFSLGILMSLTPCLLPMIPVLLGILVGHHKSKHSPFSLSLCYVLGMAFTYAIAGLLFSYIGSTLQAFMQQPGFIIALSLLFCVMALALFGAFNFSLPPSILNKLNKISEHQTRGSLIGAAIMGALATLILSPCITPPLVAVLAYISHQGNMIMGGAALFSMGLGIGVPLLIIGLLGAKVLPQSGEWMNVIKNLMGIVLLAMAMWMLQRFLPGNSNMLLWAALSFGSAWYLGVFRHCDNAFQKTEKIAGIVLLIYSALLVIGFIQHRDTPLSPIRLSQHQTPHEALHWIPIHSINDLDQTLNNPKYHNQPVLLDFYASWCISCKEMERTLFANREVRQQLQHMLLLRADVTTLTPQLQSLQQHFGVVAPPTLLFFDPQHEEMQAERSIGTITSTELLKRLQKAQKNTNMADKNTTN